MRGLERIFSPIAVNELSDPEAAAIASEPPSARRQRDLLENRMKKIENGQRILRGVVRSGSL